MRMMDKTKVILMKAIVFILVMVAMVHADEQM